MCIDLLRYKSQQYDLSLDKTDPREQCHSKRNIHYHDMFDSDNAFYDANKAETYVHDVDKTMYKHNCCQAF